MTQTISKFNSSALPRAPQTFKTILEGDNSGKMETAAFTLPFDTKVVWGAARVPVKVTINGFTWKSTVANMRGCQFIVVNREAREGAGVKAGDAVQITLAPDDELRTIEIPEELKKNLGKKLTTKLESLAFTHKKEFVKWYLEAKKPDTRHRRVEKMKQMLESDKTIS